MLLHQRQTSGACRRLDDDSVRLQLGDHATHRLANEHVIVEK
jgi:hypothetical protein